MYLISTLNYRLQKLRLNILELWFELCRKIFTFRGNLKIISLRMVNIFWRRISFKLRLCKNFSIISWCSKVSIFDYFFFSCQLFLCSHSQANKWIYFNFIKIIFALNFCFRRFNLSFLNLYASFKFFITTK